MTLIITTCYSDPKHFPSVFYQRLVSKLELHYNVEREKESEGCSSGSDVIEPDNSPENN